MSNNGLLSNLQLSHCHLPLPSVITVVFILDALVLSVYVFLYYYIIFMNWLLSELFLWLKVYFISGNTLVLFQLLLAQNMVYLTHVYPEVKKNFVRSIELKFQIYIFNFSVAYNTWNTHSMAHKLSKNFLLLNGQLHIAFSYPLQVEFILTILLTVFWFKSVGFTFFICIQE